MGRLLAMKYTIGVAALCFAALAASAPLSDPPQPHLAQAWTAMSKGDGLPNQIGFESYIYEDEKTPGSVRGHIWDYTGPASGSQNCKKIEVSITDNHAMQGTFYLGCDSVDCCYESGDHGGQPARPDVKQWDIQKSSWIAGRQTKYIGNIVTDDLYEKNITAETWFNKDSIAWTPLFVNYTYYITHKGDDVITHKIHYAPPVASGAPPGDILYGNFTVQHDLDTFRKTFLPPAMCYPQGSHKGHALSCDGSKVKEWEKKFFKHSAAAKGWY